MSTTTTQSTGKYLYGDLLETVLGRKVGTKVRIIASRDGLHYLVRRGKNGSPFQVDVDQVGNLRRGD